MIAQRIPDPRPGFDIILNSAIMIATEILEAVEEIKPFPKRLHAIVQQRILALLMRELGMDIALPELAVAVLDSIGKQIVPDVVVLAPDAHFENGVLVKGANLAVEIMSPRQSFSGIVNKCERLLTAGLVPVCWVFWPEHRNAYTFQPTRGLIQEDSTLAFTYGARSLTLSLHDILGNLPDSDE